MFPNIDREIILECILRHSDKFYLENSIEMVV